jgi:signal transduction histidine kinase
MSVVSPGIGPCFEEVMTSSPGGQVLGTNHSLRVRITLVAGVFAALFCVVVSVLVVTSMRERDAREGQERISEAIDRMIYHIRADALPRVLVRSEEQATQVLDPYGRVVTATPQIAGGPRIATFAPTGSRMRVKRTLCPPAGLKGEGCMTVVAYRVFRPDGAWIIYVAIPVVPWYANATLAIFLGVVSLLIIAMTALVAYRAVGRTLEPVDAIRVEMDAITADGLDRRVPVPANQDEIRALAESVNTTLGRLEGAYEQLRRFTADASHEVRSPLTAMRAEMEEGLMYPDDTDWPRMVQAALGGVERLQALVLDLLFLARLDAGVSLTCHPTDMTQVVEAELDRRTSRLEVVRELQESVFVRCDGMHITRVLANLMNNAERHATSQVTVVVRGDQMSAFLEVCDDGPGIPTEAREKVFGRFTRLDAARDRDTGGSGLGLAIARQIAEAHGGTLTIEDSEKGARFVLRLPRCDAVPSKAQ